LLPRARAAGGAPPFKLGLVTYNIASSWDLATLIDNCREAGIEGVEFRTTHKHGVEPTLDPAARRDVKKRCADAGVAIWGLGSACEFHAPDPAIVRANVDTCAGFARLAADLGARGVKVRPNALPKDVPPEKTLAQIGAALVECGKVAADCGVEIWLEMHGRDTQQPANIRAIMDACPHPAVGVCWNSNAPDVRDGSVKASFDLLKDRLRSCHINDLESDYPYRELFTLLRRAAYDRFTLCEYGKAIAPAEGAAFLKAYRRRWLELAGA
jgi:sugar phosphate isomerase/epimerase